LLVHEQKINQQETEEQALKAFSDNNSTPNGAYKGRGKGRGRGRGGRYNNDRENQQQHHQHQESQFQGRGRGRGSHHSTTYSPKSADKSNVECFRCHRYGHYKSECQTNLNKQSGENTNFAEKEEDVSLLMACHVKEETQQNIWYLDTGCSNHMCGDKEAFSDLDESFHSSVKFGDNSIVSFMGKGKVTDQTKGNSTHTIANVLFVPELKTNLLSVGQLQEKGYEISIKDGVCQIQDGKLGLIAQVNMTANRMFPLYLHNTTQSCLLAQLKDGAWLWQFHYGHLNFGGLKTLHQKNMMMGLPQITAPSQVCEECVVSKQHRNQFPQGKPWRAKKVLELVHSDICGPITPHSNGGKSYVITFIDDYSHKTWVYFLQEKSKAFVAFKCYKALVEKEVGNPIKVLRINHGGEYNSREFVNFCENHRIKKQLTAGYTPQHNGVSERKNRTIFNMVQSLLTMNGIPKGFWPEAVNWSIHILNRSPTLVVQNMTPEEAWSGRKPAVDHFRIFGCIAYAHIPDKKRRKLDHKGEKYIFLGVSDKSKAYKLYSPSTMKIVISRDVIFDEEGTWSWNENDVKQNIPADFDDDEKWQQPMENEQDQDATQNVPVADLSALAAESQGPQRDRRRPAWITDYEVTGVDQGDDPLTHFAMFSDCDPTIFKVAVKESKWRKAMDAEITAIEKNDTWELCNLPKGQNTIGVKWVYKTKLKENSEVDKHKARLVAKGYKQEFGVDYKEVFALVARHDTIRLVIALAAQNSWPFFQLDVKSTFLHGDLKEEAFIDQPPGYVKFGNEHKVYKLKKALYGLKQAPRAWYNRIETYFLKEGFQKCPYEHTLFIKIEDGGKMLSVSLYVDDLIYTGNNTVMFESFKKSMMAEFEMTDLGMMHYFLGIEVV
jgi:transposase InsO family protein